DRAGDQIVQEGWILDPWRANPIVALNHDTYSGLPIAKGISVTVEGHRTTSIAQFAEASVYDLADTVFKLVVNGFMGACSVGFLPEEFTMLDTGLRFERSTLLEWSCVSVPCNENALMQARAKGINTAPLVVWAERTLEGLRSVRGGAAERLRG